MQKARPRRAAIRAVNARRRALQERIGARFARALQAAFKRQGAAVRARYLASVKAPGDGLITQAEFDVLVRLFLAHEGEMWAGTTGLVTGMLDVDPPARPGLSPAARRRIATRVRNVNNVTRAAVRRTVVAGLDEGLLDTEIANNLRGVVEETYANRSQTIARTEMAISDQEAAHERYGDVGVTHVFIEDGPSCGWTKHGDSDKADGSTRTLEAAANHPIAHPNCVRSSGPILPDSLR